MLLLFWPPLVCHPILSCGYLNPCYSKCGLVGAVARLPGYVRNAESQMPPSPTESESTFKQDTQVI